jgi:hypothetical protein
MSKSESRHRTVVRAVRLTPVEGAALDAAAAARGIGPSTFARDALLRAAKLPVPKSARKDPRVEALAPLLVAISRVGNNLNQVAAKAHATDGIDMKAIDTARGHLGAIHEAILRIGSGR